MNHNPSQVLEPQTQSQVAQGQHSIAYVNLQLPKINGDNPSQKRSYILRGIVVALSIMIFFLALALPPTFEILTNQSALTYAQNKNCNPSAYYTNNQVYCQNFTSAHPVAGFVMKYLDASNQFVMMYLKIVINATDADQFKIDQKIGVEAFSLMRSINQQTQFEEFFIKKLLYNQTYQYKVQTNDMRPQRFTGPYDPHQNLVEFKVMFNYDRSLLRLNQSEGDYIVFVKFQDSNQIQKAVISIQGITVYYKFTFFTIIIRVVYCAVSTLTAIIFLRRYFQIEPENRVSEVRLVALGSIFLILYNDPFYAITILKSNLASIFFSTIFVVNMLVFLLFLWVFFLRRIYHEQNRKDTELGGIKKSWPLYLYFVALIIVCIALFLQYSYYAYYNIPIIVEGNLMSMKVIPTIAIIVILLVIIVVYQIVLYALIMKRWCSTENPPLLQRHKNYLTIYPFFLFIFILFFGFGGAMPYNYSGPWILYGYSFLNIFMFVMQYLYYTPVSQLEGTKPNSPLKPEKLSINSDIHIQMQENSHQGNKSNEKKTQSFPEQASQV